DTAIQVRVPPSCRQQSFTVRDRLVDEIRDEFRPAIFRIDAGDEKRGTAYLISATGYFLTAAHVVLNKDGTPIDGLTAAGRGLSGLPLRIVKHLDDQGIDVALIHVNPSTFGRIRPLDISLSVPAENSRIYSIGYGRDYGLRVQ